MTTTFFNDLLLLTNAGIQGFIAIAFIILIHVIPGSTRLYRMGLYLSVGGSMLTLIGLLLLPDALMGGRVLFGVGLLISTCDAIRKYWAALSDITQIKSNTYQLVLHLMVAMLALSLIWMTALYKANYRTAAPAAPTKHAHAQ